jgi:hypothetical protein
MADVAEYSSFSCVVLIVVAKALQLQVTLVKFLQRHRFVIIFLSVCFFPSLIYKELYSNFGCGFQI